MFVVDLFGFWGCSGQCNWSICLCGVDWLCSEKQSGSINRNGLSNPWCVCCACFSQLLGQSRRDSGSANSAVIALQHCETAFSTNCNGYYLNWKLYSGEILWNMCIELGTPQLHYSTFRANLRVNLDIHFGSTIISHTEPLQSTMTQPMFESENIYDLGLL